MYIKFNGKEYPVPEGSTAQETLESLKLAMPELSNAKLEKKGDNYVAKVNIGNKG